MRTLAHSSKTPPAPAAGSANYAQTAGSTFSGERSSSKVILTLLSVYVFLIVSRVLDLSQSIAALRIPLILLILLIVLTLSRGELRFAFSSKIARALAGFTAWVVVCFPFSLWRGGSRESVVLAVETFVFFLIFVQLVRTTADWRKLSGAYAYAILTAAIYGFYLARYVGEGRLSIAAGTFGDPNEFALTLLVGLPFWWLKASRATALRKVFFWACTAPVFITIVRTGSRAGMLALLTMLLVTFFMANAPRKVLICIVALIGIAAASAFLPDYLKARYLTIFSQGGTEQLDARSQAQLGADMASSDERQALLKQSIRMTFEHPVFGVGPGVFSYAAWDERKANEGVGGLALVTHNTYTQVSSETGILGFIFFVMATSLSLKYMLKDYRAVLPVDPDLARCARYLFVSWVALAVGIFFLSVAYTHMLAMFFGLAAALHNIIAERLAKPSVPANRDGAPSSFVRQPAKILREPRRIPKLFPTGRRSAPSASPALQRTPPSRKDAV